MSSPRACLGGSCRDSAGSRSGQSSRSRRSGASRPSVLRCRRPSASGRFSAHAGDMIQPSSAPPACYGGVTDVVTLSSHKAPLDALPARVATPFQAFRIWFGACYACLPAVGALDQLAFQATNGLVWGLVLALIAVGLAVIYGLTGIINLA